VTELISLVPVNSEPCFESRGDWSDGYMLAKSDIDEGVVVGPGADNSNVFAQSFPVDSKSYFKVVARARSISEPLGMAKLQINWMGEGGRFILVSQKKFEINNRGIIADEHRFAVPDGAVTGVIYVVPGDADSQVQYYEMGLYSDSGPCYKPNSNVLRYPSQDIELRSYVENLSKEEPLHPANFWERFNNKNPLCFVHIPKTAGHSVYSLLEENYSEESRVIPYHGVEGNMREILNLLPLEIEKTKVIAGHMPFGVHYYIGECNYMTLLRNPFEMVISGYYFNMENADAPTHSDAIKANLTLLQFTERNDNVMTRYLMDCSFFDATFWLSKESKPNAKDKFYLGLDCGHEVTVRSMALQLWMPMHYTRFPVADTVEKVSVECSNDNFRRDVRHVAEVQLEQSRELYSYPVPQEATGRFWRIRALSGPQTTRWGVVALKFFMQEVGALPSTGYGHHAIQGVPICSSAEDNRPASNAFDGHDRLAQVQIPPNALEKYHLEEALDNLRRYFLIGLVESYDQSISLMGKVLGYQQLVIKTRNASLTSRNMDILSDYEKKQIAEVNRYDLLLYQYAQRLFQSDCKNLLV